MGTPARPQAHFLAPCLLARPLSPSLALLGIFQAQSRHPTLPVSSSFVESASPFTALNNLNASTCLVIIIPFFNFILYLKRPKRSRTSPTFQRSLPRVKKIPSQNILTNRKRFFVFPGPRWRFPTYDYPRLWSNQTQLRSKLPTKHSKSRRFSCRLLNR